MIGTIIGDIVGSPYELNTVMEVTDIAWEPLFHPTLSKFTDDSVLTCATADAILELSDTKSNLEPDWFFKTKYKEWALKYPNRGYGGTFWAWANQDLDIKNTSYADGCMMRCSPIGINWRDNVDAALEIAKYSIEWTHNSPESLRGTSAIVSAICMGFQGKTKQQIRAFVEEQFGCWLYDSVQQVKDNWDKRNIRCNITCAQSLICFLNSMDFESAIRLAVYSQGDADTIAAIAGSLAEAFYGPQNIPRWMIEEAKKRLPQEMIDLMNRFYEHNSVSDSSPYKNFVI
jgi:ADP-ribosylglycohydrolase